MEFESFPDEQLEWRAEEWIVITRLKKRFQERKLVVHSINIHWVPSMCKAFFWALEQLKVYVWVLVLDGNIVKRDQSEGLSK